MSLKLIIHLKKINWKKGSGELIGFAICLPMIMFIILGLVMILQLGLAKQSLEYATYSAARAAVVQNDMASAENAAQGNAEAALNSGTMGIEDIGVEIELIAGRTIEGTGNIGWQKGALIRCTVSIDIDTIGPFRNSRMTSNIVMMVEFPAVNNTIS